MAPPPARFRWGTACLVQKNTPLTLIACTQSHSASVISWVGLLTPATPGPAFRIGEKTAATLIDRYGDLDGIVANAGKLSPGIQRSLAGAMDYLGPAREVVAVVRDLPLPDVDLTLPTAPKDPDLFAALTEELNLGGSAERILAALAQSAGRST